MTLDRDALIEAMARAEHGAAQPEWSWERLVIEEPAWAEGWRANAAAALPVAVRAILAPLREAHSPSGCHCCDLTICEGCVTRYPCPTVRLLDAIEADLIGDTE